MAVGQDHMSRRVELQYLKRKAVIGILYDIRFSITHSLSHAIFSSLLLAPFAVSAVSVLYKITFLMELPARWSSVELADYSLA